MVSRKTDSLRKPAQYLKGVGPQRARVLERLGIATVSDLLHHYPRAWEDRKETAVPRVPERGPLVLRCRVVRARMAPTRAMLALYRATLHVPAWEASIEAVWFKRLSRRYDVFQKLREEVRPGADLWVVGRARNSLLEVREIHVEEYYPLDDPRAATHVGRIVPVYDSTEGLSQRRLREWTAQTLTSAGESPDLMPRELAEKRGLLAEAQALRAIHFPRSFAELEEARRRLAYEELLLLELAWTVKSAQTRAVRKGYGYEVRRTLLTPFKEQLGFELTLAQKRVINEIFEDMRSPHPMTRLLQGDVGSGKTVVAIAALLLAAENGGQGAFMAPTEILAEQHAWTMARFLKGLPVKTALLTSRVKGREREKALESIRSGEARLVVGTHALLEGAVSFHRLRLAVIDEQHRFGVRQRTTLRQKGPPMDLLVMTATPIPRTLALALFGDLSVSTLDEMPPGRASIATRHGPEAAAFERLRAEVAAGRQAYVVYPIISESSRLDLKAAKAEFERLKGGELAGLRAALIHGRLPGTRKAGVMEAFARGEHDVLVATPVVEVGMDVPNATVMVVENADRFGLASLHQLRGRVGRAGHASECWLIAEPRTPEARRRIEALCGTSDGFRIGEEDLKFRGPGEMLGTAQHGELSLRVADILRDADLLAQARADARQLLDADAQLLSSGHAALRGRLVEIYQNKWRMVDLA